MAASSLNMLLCFFSIAGEARTLEEWYLVCSPVLEESSHSLGTKGPFYDRSLSFLFTRAKNNTSVLHGGVGGCVYPYSARVPPASLTVHLHGAN